jgi:tetratricopeptide (TPR) repeat protein
MKWALMLALVAWAPSVRAADAQAVRDAKVHYDRGMAHYNIGEYAAAVEEFKLAYERSGAAGLLFNAAQASRLAKDYEQALHFYRSYLRESPAATNRDDVERRILEMEALVAANRPPPPVVAPPVVAPPPPVVAPPPVVEKKPLVLPPSGRKERIAGIVVGVVGLAALGAGVGFGVAALDAQNRVSRLSTDMGSWTPAQSDLYRNGQREATAATALYAAGGAAVGVGIVTWIVGWRKDRARFAVAPVPGGAQAVWSCAF